MTSDFGSAFLESAAKKENSKACLFMSLWLFDLLHSLCLDVDHPSFPEWKTGYSCTGTSDRYNIKKNYIIAGHELRESILVVLE